MLNNFKVKNNNVVVVGGGLIGIIGALLVKKNNNNVYLIEQGKTLGGLFISRNLYKDLYFDYGSHFIRETGINPLDKLIFGDDLNFKKWHVLGNLRGASYFQNKLNDFSPFIDTRLLPNQIYKKGIKEILNLNFKKKRLRNLEDQIKSKFGKTFLKKIFEPIVSHKSFGSSLKKLAIDAHNYFGLIRIKAFDSEKSREIKKNKFFDQIFSFHDYSEGKSKIKSLYPIKGGSGFLINILKKKLIKNNIKIFTNSKISKINIISKNIQSVILNDRIVLNCKKIIWTASPNILLNYLPIISKKIKPEKFYISLHHFAFNKNFLIKSDYLQCYDPKMKTYRITFYSNIYRKKKFNINVLKKNNLYHLTLEVVSPMKEDIYKIQKIVIKEIFKMGIVSKNTKIKFKFSENLGNGVPVPNLKNLIFNIKTLASIKKRIKNIIFSTGFKGNTTGQLLNNIYNDTKNG